jgi:DnaJ homolog subfamily C member 28
MGHWESLIDRKIREAMEDGDFDDLSGQGEPIDLTENPFEDPDWRMAHRMLRNAGFAPAWIEERKDIEADVQVARTTLARFWTVLQNARNTEHARSAKVRWLQAIEDFKAKSTELNRRIQTWNLKTPAIGFHRNVIDVDREIDRITS